MGERHVIQDWSINGVLLHASVTVIAFGQRFGAEYSTQEGVIAVDDGVSVRSREWSEWDGGDA